MSGYRQKYIDNLTNHFKGNVTIAKSFLENEMYVSTKAESLVDVCTYVHKTFQAPLSPSSATTKEASVKILPFITSFPCRIRIYSLPFIFR